jgi:xylan 1,4-beta-xylosidase
MATIPRTGPELIACLLFLGLGGDAVQAEEPKAGGDSRVVAIRVKADQVRGEVRPIWRFFGYDEANYTYAPDGKKLLSEIASLKPQPAHVRTHHLLTSGDGTPWLKWSSTGVYKEDEKGRPVYNWETVDRIFDTFRERNLKPLVEIGFMPEALSVKPKPYAIPKVEHGPPKQALTGGWTYPPKDYAKWEGLIEAWAKRCAERYGREEAESWFWELWNEPNIAYWKGTPDEYNRLFDHTAAGLKRALPSARLGGPHVTGPGDRGAEKFLRQFLDHCLRGKNAVTGKTGTPLDFVAFHAKGGTASVDGHMRMNLGNHLRHVDRGLAIIASYPELKDKPVIVGESDPDGCAACSARFFPENGYRNGAQYASYTAATFMRKLDLAERHKMNLEGAVTWAFEFEDQPWFDGFRVLSSNGVVLPVFNTFRAFSLLEQRRVAVENSSAKDLDALIRESVRKEADVHAFATRGERTLSVLVWHYHDEGVPGPEATVELTLQGVDTSGKQTRLTHYRIDDRHSNAYAAWQKMGSPQKPTEEQRLELQKASDLQKLEEPKTIEVKDGQFEMRFTMPRQSVSLVRLEW